MHQSAIILLLFFFPVQTHVVLVATDDALQYF